MAQIIGSPSKYIQGNGEIAHLYDHVQVLAHTGVYAVVDLFIMDNYSDTIKQSFIGKDLPLHMGVFGKIELQQKGSKNPAV